MVDAHIHYSHDAWDMLPPDKAVAVLRQAGLALAFVSSSSDDGTQRLYAQAPDLIVPVLGAAKGQRLIDAVMTLETARDLKGLRPLLQRT